MTQAGDLHSLVLDPLLSRRTQTPLTTSNTFDAPIAQLRGLAAFTFDTLHDETAMRSFDFAQIPDGSVQISLYTKELPGRQVARLYVSGAHARPRSFNLAQASYRVQGVSFAAGAALEMIGVPLSSLGGKLIPLEDIWGPSARILTERMEACKTSAERLALLQIELLERRRMNARAISRGLTRAALRAIQSASGSIRVGALADDLGVSSRQLQRIFLEQVGLAPKRFGQVLRIRRVLNLIASKAPLDWAIVAAEIGYTDQSHLIDDFRDQLGTTPERLRLHGDFVEEPVRFGWMVTCANQR